jgi:hypothetical protein
VPGFNARVRYSPKDTMPELDLPTDATLLSIREGLTEEYVRRIYAGLTVAQRDIGNAQVRIAINDGDQAPSYRIDASDDAETAPKTQREVSNGKTHKAMLPAKAELLLWSSEILVLSQLRQLMGEIRGFKKPQTNGKG